MPERKPTRDLEGYSILAFALGALPALKQLRARGVAITHAPTKIRALKVLRELRPNLLILPAEEPDLQKYAAKTLIVGPYVDAISIAAYLRGTDTSPERQVE